MGNDSPRPPPRRPSSLHSRPLSPLSRPPSPLPRPPSPPRPFSPPPPPHSFPRPPAPPPRFLPLPLLSLLFSSSPLHSSLSLHISPFLSLCLKPV